MSLGTLAIVGAPSVGKSTIFNRIVGERRSIVEEERGITRDRLYAKATWLTKDFTVIDTGGIQLKNAPFQEEIRAQVEIALEEADVILFLVDGKTGLTGDDNFIAKLLYRSNKPVLLGVNKIDNINEIGDQSEFYSLGFGDPFPLSGAHGIGVGDVLDAIIKKLPEKEMPNYRRRRVLLPYPAAPTSERVLCRTASSGKKERSSVPWRALPAIPSTLPLKKTAAITSSSTPPAS
jgi:small GTP-binding protein domain